LDSSLLGGENQNTPLVRASSVQFRDSKQQCSAQLLLILSRTNIMDEDNRISITVCGDGGCGMCVFFFAKYRGSFSTMTFFYGLRKP